MSENVIGEQENPQEPREFSIPEGVKPWLDKKFARMTKVAREVGAVPPTYTITGEELKPRLKWHETRGEWVEVGLDKHLTITVQGEPPKLSGWQFVATLTPTEEGNLINTVPGTEEPVPKVYRTAPPVCDYCQKSRRRLDSFIVRNMGTGEYKQVGRNCLAKFLGYSNPERVARYAEILADLERTVRDEADSFQRSERPAEYLDLLEFLTMVVAVTENRGWVTRKQADETGQSASVIHVLDQLDPSWRSKVKDRSTLITPTEEHRQQAREAIKWSRSDDLVPDSDYKHNLKISTATDAFHAKAAGVVSSLIHFIGRIKEGELAREQRLQEAAERREALSGSEYVGTVGDRVKGLLVRVIRRKVLEGGQFGPTTMYRMLDMQGNVLVWFSSRDVMDEGEWYTLTGTVKRHEEYEGVKQTQLTRCAVESAPLPDVGGRHHKAAEILTRKQQVGKRGEPTSVRGLR